VTNGNASQPTDRERCNDPVIGIGGWLRALKEMVPRLGDRRRKLHRSKTSAEVLEIRQVLSTAGIVAGDAVPANEVVTPEIPESAPETVSQSAVDAKPLIGVLDEISPQIVTTPDPKEFQSEPSADSDQPNSGNEPDATSSESFTQPAAPVGLWEGSTDRSDSDGSVLLTPGDAQTASGADGNLTSSGVPSDPPSRSIENTDSYSGKSESGKSESEPSSGQQQTPVDDSNSQELLSPDLIDAAFSDPERLLDSKSSKEIPKASRSAPHDSLTSVFPSEEVQALVLDDRSAESATTHIEGTNAESPTSLLPTTKELAVGFSEVIGATSRSFKGFVTRSSRTAEAGSGRAVGLTVQWAQLVQRLFSFRTKSVSQTPRWTISWTSELTAKFTSLPLTVRRHSFTEALFPGAILLPTEKEAIERWVSPFSANHIRRIREDHRLTETTDGLESRPGNPGPGPELTFDELMPVEVRYSLNPRGPPEYGRDADVPLAESNAPADQLERLKYSIAPRGPSLVIASVQSPGFLFSSGPRMSPEQIALAV